MVGIIYFLPLEQRVTYFFFICSIFSGKIICSCIVTWWPCSVAVLHLFVFIKRFARLYILLKFILNSFFVLILKYVNYLVTFYGSGKELEIDITLPLRFKFLELSNHFKKAQFKDLLIGIESRWFDTLCLLYNFVLFI